MQIRQLHTSISYHSFQAFQRKKTNYERLVDFIVYMKKVCCIDGGITCTFLNSTLATITKYITIIFLKNEYARIV